MVVFPTCSYPTTISLDRKRGGARGERARSRMYLMIASASFLRTSRGIDSSPSVESRESGSNLSKKEIEKEIDWEWKKSKFRLESGRARFVVLKFPQQGFDDWKSTRSRDFTIPETNHFMNHFFCCQRRKRKGRKGRSYLIASRESFRRRKLVMLRTDSEESGLLAKLKRKFEKKRGFWFWFNRQIRQEWKEKKKKRCKLQVLQVN